MYFVISKANTVWIVALFGVIGRIARKTLHSKCRISLSLGVCSETWRHTTFLITSPHSIYTYIFPQLNVFMAVEEFQVLRLLNFLTIFCVVILQHYVWAESYTLEECQLESMCSTKSLSGKQIRIKAEQKHTCCQGEEYQPRTTGPLLPAITRGTSGQGPRLQPCWRSTRGLAVFLHLRMGNSTYLNGRGEVKAVWQTVNYCCVSNRVML